jgi:aminopeptidase YwaD
MRSPDKFEPRGGADQLTAAERSLVGAISTGQIQSWLEWFSNLGLRLGGSPAEAEAARYVADELQKFDIASEVVGFDSFVSYGREPSKFGPATVQIVDGSINQPYVGKVYAFGASTGPDGIESEIVWVGTGSPADYERLGADVRGKIALSELSFEAPHGEPTRVAMEHGAVGAIIANWSDDDPGYIHTGTARGVWGNPGLADLERLPTIPVVSISRRAGLELAERASKRPLRVKMVAETTTSWVRAAQPIATIPGASERFILVYCHLDTFGAGMTDNASGVVGLMELARVLKLCGSTLPLTVRFAWWGCHEMPYNGSTWYLDAHWDDIRDHCVAVINTDCWGIGESEGQVELWSFAELEDAARAWARDVVGVECAMSDFDAKEAEQSFWAIGVPSAMAFSVNKQYDNGKGDGMPYLGPWFHTEHDTIEHVGIRALGELVSLYMVAIHRLASESGLPLRYSATAAKFSQVLRAVAVASPPELSLDLLAEKADRLAELCRRLETSHSASADDCAMRLGRILNPVLYTIAGRYGQDPSSATYLRKRLPGLQKACDDYYAIPPGDERRHAGMTDLVRQRNRVADALAEATEVVRMVVDR